MFLKQIDEDVTVYVNLKNADSVYFKDDMVAIRFGDLVYNAQASLNLCDILKIALEKESFLVDRIGVKEIKR